MPLHPEAPETVTGDPDSYAAWRRDHQDVEERKSSHMLSETDTLAFFRDEFWEAMETPDSIAMENAEIELETLGRTGPVTPH